MEIKVSLDYILCWFSFFFYFSLIFFSFFLKKKFGFLNVQRWIFWKEMSLVTNQETVCHWNRVVWQDPAALSDTSYHALWHLIDILVKSGVSSSEKFPLTSSPKWKLSFIPHWHLLHYIIFSLNILEQDLRYGRSKIGIVDLSSSCKAHKILKTSSCLLFDPRNYVPLLTIFRRHCNLVKKAPRCQRPESYLSSHAWGNPCGLNLCAWLLYILKQCHLASPRARFICLFYFLSKKCLNKNCHSCGTAEIEPLKDSVTSVKPRYNCQHCNNDYVWKCKCMWTWLHSPLSKEEVPTYVPQAWRPAQDSGKLRWKRITSSLWFIFFNLNFNTVFSLNFIDPSLIFRVPATPSCKKAEQSLPATQWFQQARCFVFS